MGSLLGLANGLSEFFLIPGVTTLWMIRSVTLTVVSMVRRWPGPNVHRFWIGYFCSFVGRRAMK